MSKSCSKWGCISHSSAYLPGSRVAIYADTTRLVTSDMCYYTVLLLHNSFFVAIMWVLPLARSYVEGDCRVLEIQIMTSCTGNHLFQVTQPVSNRMHLQGVWLVQVYDNILLGKFNVDKTIVSNNTWGWWPINSQEPVCSYIKTKSIFFLCFAYSNSCSIS